MTPGRLQRSPRLQTPLPPNCSASLQRTSTYCRARHADVVAVADHRGEVADEDQEIVRVFGAADERNDARVDVVEVDPLEAGPVVVDLEHRFFPGVEQIQLAHVVVKLVVPGILQQIPAQAGLPVPLFVLAEFAAHEQQLLAGWPYM